MSASTHADKVELLKGTREHREQSGDLYKRSFEMGTPCKLCGFAEWDSDEQTGCSVGRIAAYGKSGVNIVDVTDGEKEFFLVQDRICNMFRGPDWLHGDNSLPARVLRADSEVRFKLVDVVVYTDGDDTVEDVAKTLDSLVSQGPHYVHIVDNTGGPDHRLMPLTFELPRWRLHNIKGVKTFWETLNGVGDTCASLFYAVFRAGHKVDSGFIDALHERVNRKVLNFSAARPFMGHGLIVQSAAHKSVAGSSALNVLEKIEERCIEQETRELVIEYLDLYETTT